MAETSQQFIKDIRDRLRIKHTHLDKEITDLIGEARAELLSVGILASKANDESDMLIRRAIFTYAKAEFGLDNDDSEDYRASFEKQKIHISNMKEYTVEEV